MLIEDCRVLYIVVYYHSDAEILECINSIINSKSNYTIYVYLNSELSENLFFLRNQRDILFVESSFNVGFGSAVNFGFQYAIDNNFKFVVLMNPDVIFSQPDLIIRMIEISKKYNSRCLLSPMHFTDNIYSELDEKFNTYLSTEKIIDDSISILPFVNAAFWMLPINVVKLVGGFDPLFFLYGEDNNYTYRLIKYKIPVIVIRNLAIVHSRKSKILDTKRTYFKSKYFICQEIIKSNKKSYIGYIFLVLKLVSREFYSRTKSFVNILMYFKILVEVLILIKQLRNRNKLYVKGAFLNLNK